MILAGTKADQEVLGTFKKLIVCPASGALIVKICLLLFSLHVLLLLVCVKYVWFSFYLEWMHVCACVCVCDRTDLPSCPVPCRCAYTSVNVCSWISFLFSLSSWAPLMCRCHCLFEKYLAVHFRILAFFPPFIDLTGLSQCDVLQWKGVALLCNVGGSSILLRSLLVKWKWKLRIATRAAGSQCFFFFFSQLGRVQKLSTA